MELFRGRLGMTRNGRLEKQSATLRARLFVWSAVEVFPALGLHDFVVADDASVRLARIVHRLGLGRVRVGFELGSQRFRHPVGLGLGRIVELEWNKALRRGEGESVDWSSGLLFDLLGRESGAG